MSAQPPEPPVPPSRALSTRPLSVLALLLVIGLIGFGGYRASEYQGMQTLRTDAGHRLDLFGAAVDEFSAGGARQRFGNLVATRLPVLQVQHHALPWPADGGVTSMPRMCTVLTLRDPGLGALRVMTTHLEYYSKPQRMAQAQNKPAVASSTSG